MWRPYNVLKNNRLTVLFAILGLTCPPTLAIADIQSTTSSDLMAEIEFLEDMYPKRPGVFDLKSIEEAAFSTYLSSYAVCEGWEFKEYRDFVAIYEMELQPFIPADSSPRISLSEDSYKRKVDGGCEINEDAKAIVESIFGNVESYYLNVKNQAEILDAIQERKIEMLRRTLDQ